MHEVAEKLTLSKEQKRVWIEQLPLRTTLCMWV